MLRENVYQIEWTLLFAQWMPNVTCMETVHFVIPITILEQWIFSSFDSIKQEPLLTINETLQLQESMRVFYSEIIV